MGYLQLIFGPMCSGKSTECIKIYNKYKIIDKINIMVISHILDNRYGDGVVSSHNKDKIKCHSVEKLNSLKENKEYVNANVILIEEAQFFNDLKEFVINAIDNDNKIVYVFGLDGDFKKNCFGQICELVPHAEDVVKLKGICIQCKDGTPASFTKKRSINENLVEIGNHEIYDTVCRKCFNSQ